MRIALGGMRDRAGGDIAHIVNRVFQGLPNVDALLQDPRNGLPQLELLLNRFVLKQCQAAFLGDPFHIGLPLAYLILHGFEIEDLTVLIEAKANQLPAEQFRPFLLADGLARG